MNASARRPVVLIVEDEFLLRMDAAHTIEDARFEVLEASSADEAIERDSRNTIILPQCIGDLQKRE